MNTDELADSFPLQYHLRLYTIDSQVEHADNMSLGRLGSWIVRRTAHCEGKLREALAMLETCGFPEEILRAEWDNQVATQTKPLARKCLFFLPRTQPRLTALSRAIQDSRTARC